MAKSKKRGSKKKSSATLETGALFASEKAVLAELDSAQDQTNEEEDIVTPTYMQNRELSWLSFNERVLDQGADESVPLLDRLNFISIFWSNLQEFFMVRVGSLTDLSFIKPPVRESKTGMTPKEQIRAIHERCAELYPIQESYYEHVRGSLAKEGVRHLRPDDLSEEQRNYLGGLVEHNIAPFLSPQIINSRHPFPHLENGKLYILVRLDDEADSKPRKKKKDREKSGKKNEAAEGVVLGLIPLPHQVDRLIKLPGRGYQFILLEHAIEMFAEEIFSMYTIKHTNVICVTRNADMDASQGDDSSDEDYREHMKRLLKQRARLAPVRLECERPLSPVMEKLMLKKLDLKRYQVYDTTVPLDLSFTWGLGSKLSEKKRAKLSNPPFQPAWPTCFDRNSRIIDQVQEKEILLSYPYESMDPFVQLLKEASQDPTVISIKITLYRLASQSHLAEALIAAAENGKEVTALFELRARFDEFNNIEWSQRFEEAGCNVIYGFRDYKVHSKICCITRQTESGIQHITQLGTGNYNEKTAKLYTDLSFITTNEAFGRDAVEFFKNMQLENTSDNYEILRVAPLQIKPTLIENIDREIDKAQQGLPCGIFMKANSVTDKDIIEKLSEASQAGVPTTLFIRGICCIIPGVKDATENVRVVSIVGRLLEHSRIYCFGTGDDCRIYLSSADLMTRNLDKRVEIAWPVLNAEIRQRILEYLDVCMSDTAKLRELRPNLTYTPLGSFCEVDEDGNSLPAFDAQNALIEMKALAAHEATIAEATVSYEETAPDDSSDMEPEAEQTEDEVYSTPKDAATLEEALETEPLEDAVPEIEEDIEAEAETDDSIELESENESEPVAVEAFAEEVSEPVIEEVIDEEVSEPAIEEVIEEEVELESDNPTSEDEPVEVDELEIEQFFEEIEFDELDEEASDERPLTDYTVDELLAFDDPVSNEPGLETENEAQNETEDVASMTDMTVEEILSTPEDAVESDIEDSAESVQEEPQELVAEPESNTQPGSDTETSFFEEPTREVVIPKEKQGFFARLFKNS